MTKLQLLKSQLVITFVLEVGVLFYAKAQTDQPSIDKGSIENRFNYVMQKSEDHEDSKMVKKWMLYRLKSYVLDSLKEAHHEIFASKKLLALKDAKIDSLKNIINAKDESLSTVKKEKNSIELAGISMSKYLYNTIMWSALAILVFLLFVFILLYKNSNAVAVKNRKALNELSDEYESYRKRALEREQKIVREMYDEILKLKNKSK
jgi:DNA mismatch repair ATPase MutS